MWRFCCLGVEYYERSTTPLGKICAIGFEDWGQGRTNKQNIFFVRAWRDEENKK